MFVCKQFACLKQKRGFVYTKHRVRLKIFRVYVCAYTVHVLDKVREREREIAIFYRQEIQNQCPKLH